MSDGSSRVAITDVLSDCVSKPRILIVDDEPHLLRMLHMVLRTRWVIDTATNIAEALETYKAFRHSLLLVDKNLPDGSGVELIRTVRKMDRKVAIVMMTGYASTDSANETLNIGIDHYIEKPFKSIDDVIEAINSGLRRSASLAGEIGATDTVDVLVVSTDKSLRDELTAELKLHRCQVREATTLAEMREAATTKAPDLAIVDGTVRGGDVVRVAADVKAIAPLAKCAVTAEVLAFETLTRLIDLGVMGSIMEPRGTERFARRTREILDKLRHG